MPRQTFRFLIQDHNFSESPSTLSNDLLDSANDYKQTVKLYSDTDIKSCSSSKKTSLKSKSSLHHSKISQRKRGRPKLTKEEREKNKKESDRQASRKYSAKKKQERENDTKRLKEKTATYMFNKGRTHAMKETAAKPLLGELEFEQFDISEKNFEKLSLLSLDIGKNLLQEYHSLSQPNFAKQKQKQEKEDKDLEVLTEFTQNKNGGVKGLPDVSELTLTEEELENILNLE